MKPFASNLQRLRELRDQSQQLAQVTVALRQAERDAITSQTDALTAHVQGVEAESTAALAQGTDGVVLQSVHRAIAQLETTLEQTLHQQHAATRQLQDSLHLWQQAKQQAKLVEELVDRQRVIHLQGERKLEEHAAHEQVVQRAHREQFEAAQRKGLQR